MRSVKTFSLSHKALLALAAILLPIIISIYAGYRSNSEYLEKLIFGKLSMMAEGYEGLIYQFLEMNRRRAQDFSSDGFIRDHMRRIVNGDNTAVIPLNEHLTRNKMPLDKTIHAIHTISMKGVVVASTNPSLIGMDVTGEPFFKDINGNTVITDNVQGFEDVPALGISSLLTDRVSGAPLGVIVNIISLSELGKIMTGEVSKELGAISWSKGRLRTMETYIVTKNKLMITESRFTKDAVLRQSSDTLPVNACLESNTETVGFYKDYRGIEVAGSSMCIPSLKWTLLVEVNRDEIIAPMIRMKWGAVTLFVAVAGFIGILFLVFRAGVTVPLNRVSHAAKEVAHGNFNVTVPVLSGDEIGVLSESFNEMALELGSSTTKLRRSEASLNEAQRIARVGSWELDLVNNLLVWSDEIFRIFEIDPNMFGASYEAFLDTIHPEDRAMVNAAYTNSLKTKTPYSIDHRLLFPDGSIKHVHEQCETFYDKDGKPIRSAGTVQDVTERKLAEDEIRKLNEELERRVMERTAELVSANKELEAFSYSVSHDLRAPLRHVAGYANLLQKNASSQLDESGKRQLTVIADAAKKMGTLIDDLLAFSRAGRSEMQKKMVNLNQLVRESMEDLRKETEGRGITWKIGELPEVYGDHAMLRLVFMNLISNAIKYTGKKERAEIEIGWKTGDEDDIIIYVKDNGVGFDMKYEGKLFGVFQRLHRQDEFEGTGIGLANVRRIIHRHGGKTWAEGTVGEGATFYFSLPVFRRI